MILGRGTVVHNKKWVVDKSLQASEELAQLVGGAAGPDGRAVLAHSLTTITRSGAHILNLAFPSPPSDPFLSLLLQSISELHEIIGDGVKNFVILTNALLKQVIFKSSSQTLIRELSVLQTRLSVLSTTKCTCVLTSEVLSNIIVTFFSTRFAPTVSAVLSRLVFEWVAKLNGIPEICRYITQFSSLCFKFNSFPVASSCVQDGFMIKGLSVNRLPHSGQKCILRVYYHSMDTTPDNGDIETDILEVLKVKTDSTASLNYSVLFVTNLVLEDRALFLLNYKKIFTIHAVCNDSIKFLFEQTVVKNVLVVDYRYINDLLWISLQDVSHLVLKGPSATFTKDYADSVLDCLKMLLFSFKDMCCTVNAGGYFEHALVKKMFSESCSKDCKARMPPVTSREQILNWCEDGNQDSECLKCFDPMLFHGLDSEAVDVVCRAVFSSVKLHFNDKKCLEPVSLRLAVIARALNATIAFCKLDGALIKPKKGRLC
ncbi:hypothetical protein J6590_004147 [Homalodisca vitripennis]|nr:hypothetical protein J6590_004147 [Homalodisca vitripennis]